MIESVNNLIQSRREETFDKRILCHDHSTANIELIGKGY